MNLLSGVFASAVMGKYPNVGIARIILRFAFVSEIVSLLPSTDPQ